MSAWSKSAVAEAKARIKAEVDAVQGGPVRRLKHVQLRLAELALRDDPKQALDRYVYSITALVHHERYRGLTKREINGLVDVAHGILRANAVKPGASMLASLYGDIHLILGQIFRNNGEPWQAAWEQHVALDLAGDFPSGGVGFQQVALANRHLRLGNNAATRRCISAAYAAGVPDFAAWRPVLTEMTLNWLAGDADAFNDAAARALAIQNLGAEEKVEIDWHLLRIEAQVAEDPSVLAAAVRRGKPHYQTTYIIESALWCMAHRSRAALERAPSLSALYHNKPMQARTHGAWFDVAYTLSQAYDYAIPLPIRLRSVARALERRGELVTVDKELIFLAATARWLSRSKASDLAALVLAEYEQLSLRLSMQRNSDVLGLVQDIYERPWASVLAHGPQSRN